MATTRLMPLHVGKGRNISTAISDIIDYVENPQKTDFGKFIYGYECDTRLADAEFLLSKRQYANLTGRNQGADDVIAYHLRQAFKPGEVTPARWRNRSPCWKSPMSWRRSTRMTTMPDKPHSPMKREVL